MFLASLAFLSASLTSAIVNPTDSYPARLGPNGTLYTIGALPLESSTFGAGLYSNFFSEDDFIDGNKQSRNQFRVAGFYTFFEGFEVYTGTTFTFSDNSTAAGARSATTFFENTDLGAKYVYPLLTFNTDTPAKFWKWNIGAYGNARFLSGGRTLRNTSGVTEGKSGPHITGLGGFISTLDFKEMWKAFPFRHHINIGVRGANADIVGVNRQLDRFSLDGSDYTAITYATSIEAIYRWVSPFIEYSGEFAILAPSGDNLSADDNRSKLTLGVRGRPMRALGIHAGVNVGLGGPGAASNVGIPRNTPFEFIAGITFQAVASKIQDTEGSLRGVVTDKETGMPLSDVEVTLVGEITRPIRTDLSGFYEIPELQNGNYEVKFEKTDYFSTSRNFVISGDNEDLDIALQSSIPTEGDISLQITDEETGDPIQNAAVRVNDQAFATDSEGRVRVEKLPEGSNTFRVTATDYLPTEVILDVVAGETVADQIILRRDAPDLGKCEGTIVNDNGTPLTAVITPQDTGLELSPVGTDPLTGEFSFSLPPGVYRFQVQAENYLPQEMECNVESAASDVISLVLQKPETAVVVENKIILPDAIYFEFNSAEIKGESFTVLDQVVSVLGESLGQFDSLSIQGHTDNIGSNAYNQGLSRRRAESVRDYLLQKGIPANKVTAVGFGESQPIATNVTDEGRAENRRVEFNLIREGNE